MKTRAHGIEVNYELHGKEGKTHEPFASSHRVGLRC